MAHPGEDPAENDRGGALDVVVERADAVAIAVEDPQRVVLLEVLPLDDAARPALGDAGDERLDQRVVRRAAQPRLAMPEIQRVGEEERVVGPDVERHRQRQRRMDARCRGVERELADRDRHAACALVAEAEDPLVVGDDDQPDVVVRAVAEELRDPVDVGRRDPQPARPADDVAELLAGPPDRRRVDDRQELLGVLREQPVEERRVAILERRQADVLLERVRLPAEVLELQLDLLIDRQDAVREEPDEPERGPLVGWEGEVLRQEPGPEQGRRPEGDPGRPTGRDVVEGGGKRLHRGSSLSG